MKLTDSLKTRDLSCQVEPLHCLQLLNFDLLVHVEQSTCNQLLTDYTDHQSQYKYRHTLFTTQNHKKHHSWGRVPNTYHQFRHRLLLEDKYLTKQWLTAEAKFWIEGQSE